jgi:hypothetical protein
MMVLLVGDTLHASIAVVPARLSKQPSELLLRRLGMYLSR